LKKGINGDKEPWSEYYFIGNKNYNFRREKLELRPALPLPMEANNYGLQESLNTESHRIFLRRMG
jgi:hypothetical protein